MGVFGTIGKGLKALGGLSGILGKGQAPAQDASQGIGGLMQSLIAKRKARQTQMAGSGVGKAASGFLAGLRGAQSAGVYQPPTFLSAAMRRTRPPGQSEGQ